MTTRAGGPAGPTSPVARGPLDIERLLRPASVAIIGASADEAVISGIPQRVLAQHGYFGAVYPVNPRYTEIDGVTCYPDITTVPGPVDVVLVVVNASRVVDVLEACGQSGVRFAVVISSGFAEQSDGAERQRELAEVCARHPGMRVLGPNAEGLINVVDDVPLGFSPTTDYRRGLVRLHRGDVAVVSQSGGLGFALFNDGLSRGLGFSHVISTGNEIDVDLTDLAEALLADPATRVLLLFVEGVADPARLGALGARAGAAGKTVVVAKVGNSGAGRRAALAHTAHDAGEEALYRRVLDHPGVLWAHDQEHMIDLALALSRTRRPAGRRVGIVTVSGGAGTWLADDLVAAGLEVPLLSPQVQALLRERIPPYGSPANPVDATAQVLGLGGVSPVVRILADSGEVDAVVLVATLADQKQLEREREYLATLAASVPLVIYSYTRPGQASIDLLEELGIAFFTSTTRTAGALAALAPAIS
ncbi:CoA-binding protein [Pseudonocardia xinjiangensis]